MARRKSEKDIQDPGPSKPTQTTRHRRKRRLSPSTSVLALLAAVAPQASSTPLDFLYPTPELRGYIPIPTPTPTLAPRHLEGRGILPAKYVKESDGQWRKAETVSLYGSTVCTTNCPALEVVVATSSASVASTTTSLIMSNLPSGWQPYPHAKGNSKEHVTLIITLSLGLASFIVFCMIGCLFIRKTRRRSKYALEDVEGKAGAKRRRRKSKIPEESVDRRTWAKATARWKDGAMRAARRRRTIHWWRGASSGSSATVAASSPTNPPPTESRSRRSSAESRRSASIARETHDPPTETSLGSQVDLIPPDSRRDSISPPAYPHPPQSSHLAVSTAASGKARYVHPATSNSNISSMYEHSNYSAEISSSFAPVAGHVATDDKARLAHMASMASAPESSTHAQDLSSAPQWDDDQLEPAYVGPSSPHVDRATSSPPPETSFLPSPPEKPRSYDDPLSDESYEYATFNVVPLHSEGSHAQPSAPPFEEHVTASAPPADDLEELPLGPSAPAFEETLESNDRSDQLGEPAGQNHDRQPPSYPT